MNQAQKNYTTRRINEIEQKKICDLSTECTIPAVSLTPKQKYDLIKSGKVVLLPLSKFDANQYGYCRIDGFYDFSKFERYQSMSENFEKRKEKIKLAASKARDSVMLGDDSEALGAIQAFEKFKA